MKNYEFTGIFFMVSLTLSPMSAKADSLFNPDAYRPVVSDHKAYHKGDVLTVLVYEDAIASTSTNTDTNKKGSVSGKIGNAGSTESGAVEMGSGFRGGGKTERSGKLSAHLTVTVQDVHKNGDLVIKGKQLVKFNDEQQEIAIEGMVRPVDIAPNNTVLSSRISDARLSYSGRGILAEKQKQGVLTRFLSWLRIL